MRFLFVSSHAIDRYQQRVRPTATRLEALAEIREITRRAKARPSPRWWTRVAGDRPGCRYLYSASRPDVCLVVKDGVVLTVFSRDFCAQWRKAAAGSGRDRWLTPVPESSGASVTTPPVDQEAA